VLLVAEVSSSGSSRHDRITKRRFFQANGVPDYWVIDGEAEAFEIWHPSDKRAALVDDRVLWQPGGADLPFELNIRDSSPTSPTIDPRVGLGSGGRAVL
jgi:Uma2 family endonuclease